MKYKIIYADPAWSFKNYDNKTAARWVGNKYSVMSLKDICNLKVQTISDDNCILFIWVTMPKLNEVFEVIKAWGFEYKTVAFTWVKRNKKSDSWFWGMGRWTRSNSELCLIATKGNPKRISASVHSVIDTPIEGHSKKPDVTRDKILQLVGDLPRVELFARQKTNGWDVWGNEVKNDIIL